MYPRKKEIGNRRNVLWDIGEFLAPKWASLGKEKDALNG